jgi:hypothetical protein
MSNNYNVNPIVLDSTMASGWKALTNLGSPLGAVLVEKIYWENPATIGDVVTITDGFATNPVTLLALRCEVANQSQLVDWTSHPKAWRDFEVTAIGSGTLYIYVR